MFMITLGNFSEGVQCSQWIYKFLKLLAKKNEPLLFRRSLLLLIDDLSILLLSIKAKPLDKHRLWIFFIIAFSINMFLKTILSIANLYAVIWSHIAQHEPY